MSWLDDRISQMREWPIWTVIALRVAVTIAALLLFGWVLRRAINRYASDDQLRYRGRKAVSFALILITIVVVLSAFSAQLGTLTLAIGAASAGVAFALQEVIVSVAGWVAILFGGFYRTGDRVELGGIRGDVVDIGILRTTIMEMGEWVRGDRYNGRIVRVANSFIFKAPVYNYSADFPFLWEELRVPIRYGSDHKAARAMLERVVDDVCGEYAKEAEVSWSQMVGKYSIEDARVKPFVFLEGNDNWIEFSVRYVTDFKFRAKTKDDLWTRIIEEVAASDGAFTLASATYEVVAMPQLRLARAERVPRKDRADA